jgi:hypothetical protein
VKVYIRLIGHCWTNVLKTIIPFPCVCGAER